MEVKRENKNSFNKIDFSFFFLPYFSFIFSFIYSGATCTNRREKNLVDIYNWCGSASTVYPLVSKFILTNPGYIVELSTSSNFTKLASLPSSASSMFPSPSRVEFSPSRSRTAKKRLVDNNNGRPDSWSES